MKTGSEIIIDVLAEEGVETIFGYSGGAICLRMMKYLNTMRRTQKNRCH